MYVVYSRSTLTTISYPPSFLPSFLPSLASSLRRYCRAVARASYPAEFDISLHRFRHSAVHWRTGQATLARFKYTDLIRNARFFAEAYNVADFATKTIDGGEANSSAAFEEFDGSSDTVLVHSTARLDDAEVSAICFCVLSFVVSYVVLFSSSID